MPLRFFKLLHLKRKRKFRYQVISPPYSNCKNCGHELKGQYCAVCGQFAHLENKPFRESVGFYMEHHFALDHKLGKTLLNLLFKPGKLTNEFLEGRIASYVHPFKLYFFSSILFFGIVLNFTEKDHHSGDEHQAVIIKTEDVKSSDSSKSSTDKEKKTSASAKQDKHINSATESDDNQDEVESDFDKRIEDMAEKKLGNMSQEELGEMFIHNVSYSMLVLMPIFALLLKLFYIRRKHTYLSHLIHSIHLHSTLFVVVSVTIIYDHFVKGASATKYGVLAMLAYLVISLMLYYHQGFFKSTLKAFLLLFFYFIACLIAIVGSAIMMVLI